MSNDLSWRANVQAKYAINNGLHKVAVAVEIKAVHSRAGLTKPVRFDRLPVKPVRPGYGLGRYQTGPNSKFKFELKK